MRYVDGYVLPVPKKNLKAYRRMARWGARLWKKHGAQEYFECAGDNLKVKFGMPFTRLVKLKPGETVVFAFVIFKSRAHRDAVNARVMNDPLLAKMPKKMPFDPKRMAYGGFRVLVEA